MVPPPEVPLRSPPCALLHCPDRMRLLAFVTLFGVLFDAGDVLQIQCYQCEEMSTNDCTTPDFIVNCTVNVQDMCQKEVLVKPDGIHYRKSCASSGACLIASSGYQQFCTGRLNSVCITCCNTPLIAMAETEAPSAQDATSIFNFVVPKKEINMVPDMGKWKRSQAYADYMGFVLTLNEGVKRKKLTCEYETSETVEKLLGLLDTLNRWIDETPPVDQPSRFGNQAFRTWYSKLDKNAEALVAAVLPADKQAAVPEIAVYLKESVGNQTRIDYGTGHEAAFAAFLCCLCKVEVLRVDDQLAMVFKVFNRYLQVMRKLQKTYRMEPAGSQGVWGLDDFQFLPFIWGSSQFVDHPALEPRHFIDEKVVNDNHQDYMFLDCIKFINEMKTGPFAEHSNQLWNISAVPSWSKVNQGLIKMYKAECLEKFPVIQHFKFGSLLSIEPVKP